MLSLNYLIYVEIGIQWKFRETKIKNDSRKMVNSLKVMKRKIKKEKKTKKRHIELTATRFAEIQTNQLHHVWLQQIDIPPGYSLWLR